MEAPKLLENGNIPQERKFTSCQVAFYTLIFVLIIISAVVSVVFCLLHHKQSSTPNTRGVMSWEWNLEHCDGFVQKDRDQYLIIKQSGNYFIYAQVNRKQIMEQSFTLVLCKEPDILLNKVVGPKMGDEKGTVNFGRPFFLQKGDKLYCQGNYRLNYILAGNQTYWGLYKI
uniref:THD domain-containing protein n=1 Tax=Aquila chrysaetos chrysaetos TaxID=223781 RepID=A0A663DM14_AQUCH